MTIPRQLLRYPRHYRVVGWFGREFLIVNVDGTVQRWTPCEGSCEPSALDCVHYNSLIYDRERIRLAHQLVGWPWEA